MYENSDLFSATKLPFKESWTNVTNPRTVLIILRELRESDCSQTIEINHVGYNTQDSLQEDPKSIPHLCFR